MELPGAKCLRALGLSPNAVTLLGFVVSVAGAFLVAIGWLFVGGIVFLLGGFLDLFDGALARLTHTDSPFGALLDSVFDRLGEAGLFVGLAVYSFSANFSDGETRLFVTVLLLALIFSQGVSYLRARGEGLGAFTRGGIMTRTERILILGAGLMVDGLVGFHLMIWVLLLIAVVSCFTLFQRMLIIRNILGKGG